MKTIPSAILASFVAVAVHAQNSVPSVNAAGYIKATCAVNKFYFLQVPFNTFDGSSYTLDTLIGTALPDGSSVYAWNTANQTYDISNYIDGLGWSPDLPLARGQGFFVLPSPESASSPTYDLFLFGEVPGATTSAMTTMNLSTGFTAVGFPYPVTTTLIDSGLTQITEDGDSVFMWNAGTQTYEIFNRLDVPGLEWNGDEDKVIPPGVGLFIGKANAGSYVSQVPYSWPNN